MIGNQDQLGLDRPTLSQSQQALVQAVENELRTSGYAALSQVGVGMVGQAIVLEGTAPTEFCRRLAQAIARRTRGVKNIINRIAVITEDKHASSLSA